MTRPIFSRYKKAVIIDAIGLAVCALVFAVLASSGAFRSRDIVSVSVTYDADPYNGGQSNPHTYAVTDVEDIAFLEDTLDSMKPLSGGGNCGFKQIVLHVTYADGREADYYPAGDSCNTIAVNNPDSSDNHFELPEERHYKFRQIVSRYIPELAAGGNWWLEGLD